MKKKIAFVVAIPLTARAFLTDHFAHLLERYDVHLIANFPDEKSKMEFESMGVICHQAPIKRAISIGGDIKGLFALKKIFKREKFDCVHSVTPKAGLLTALAGKLAGVPNRVHIFTGQVWCNRKGVMRIMLKSMDKVIAACDTRLLVDGEGQRQFLIKEGVLTEKNSKVPAEGSIAGIKLDRYVISAEVRAEERRNLGFTDDDVVYVFLGRLNHDKGIGELYEAFNRLVGECPNARLLFYGMDEDGYEEKAGAYANIKKGVNYFFPGLTKTPYKALQAGDVFVLPTRREGFGVSVLEAQALGLPVITSDAYGVVDASVGVRVNGERLTVNGEWLTVNGEWVRVNGERVRVNGERLTVNGEWLTVNERGEELTGLRCGVNDPEGLYQAMKVYYDDADMRKKHGMAGRKRVEKHFSNDVVSKAWLEIYEEMLGRGE